MVCKRCESKECSKNGKVRGLQRYLCKNCNYNFVKGDRRTDARIQARKACCVILYSLGKMSVNMIAKLFDMYRSLVYKWLNEAAVSFGEYEIEDDIEAIEFDEMWHFIGKKTNKLWIIKAVDRSKHKTIAWVTGKRDTKTFRKLYNKLKHLKKCKFYTDDWEVFSKVLPKDRHVIGKEHTVTIEQDNSNTRHHLSRFTRKTKVVSKSENMVNTSLKLWQFLTENTMFKKFRNIFLSIF